MARGALVSSLYSKLMLIDSTAAKDSAATSLMSSDIESIARGLPNIQEIWACIVQSGFAIWLMQRQLGIACVIPVAVSLGMLVFVFSDGTRLR